MQATFNSEWPPAESQEGNGDFSFTTNKDLNLAITMIHLEECPSSK